MVKNTNLCIDLKTFLQKDALLGFAKNYNGTLMRDGEDHYVFIESAVPATPGKRNPQVYKGDLFTMTLKDDGALRLNFKPLKVTANFNIDSYALGVCNEIRNALKGLVEK